MGLIGALFERVFMALKLVGMVEAGLLLLAILVAAFRPALLAGPGARLERAIAPLLARPWLQLALILGLAVLLRAAMLPVLGTPTPRVNDEFSLIYQGETFAAGRLANPPHPLGESFEAVHINQRPAAASIYFPGRGLPHAVGIALAGNAWIGVWLSFLLLAGASLWMLRGWVRPGYAFAGALIVVLRWGVFSYWVNSYWGGAFTAFGAALVVGAYPRILRRATWRDGVLLGAGVAALITTRPYESLLLCAPFAVALLVWLIKQLRAREWGAPLRLAAPALLLLTTGAGFVATYNQATTGDALTTPYTLNRAQYATAPAMLTSPPLDQPAGLSARFRAFYEMESASHDRRETLRGWLSSTTSKLHDAWMFYLGPVLTIPFLIGLTAWRRTPILFVAGGLVLAGFLIETWDFPHYIAPAFPIILIVTMAGFERLRGLRWPGPDSGLALSRAIPAIAALALLVPALHLYTGWPPVDANHWNRACCAIVGPSPRARTMTMLERLPGRDLVIVRYDPNGSIHDDWVYNAPDLDRAPIVWARDCGPTQNRRLIDLYPDRRIWLVGDIEEPIVDEIRAVPPRAFGDTC